MVVRSIKELGVIIAAHSEEVSSQSPFSHIRRKCERKKDEEEVATAVVVVTTEGEGCTGSTGGSDVPDTPQAGNWGGRRR